MRSFVAAPPDSSAHRIFRSGDHSWVTAAGNVQGATTPTRDSHSVALAPFPQMDALLQRQDGLSGSTPRMAAASSSSPRTVDAAGAVASVRPPQQRSGPRSSEIILGPPNCGSEIPKEHLVRHERLDSYGPQVWRACWKDIPAMIQEVSVLVPCVHGVSQRGQIISMWRGKSGSETMQPYHASRSGGERLKGAAAAAGGGGSALQQSPRDHTRTLSRQMSSNAMQSFELTNDSSIVGDTLNDFSMHESSTSSHGESSRPLLLLLSACCWLLSVVRCSSEADVFFHSMCTQRLSATDLCAYMPVKQGIRTVSAVAMSFVVRKSDSDGCIVPYISRLNVVPDPAGCCTEQLPQEMCCEPRGVLQGQCRILQRPRGACARAGDWRRA